MKIKNVKVYTEEMLKSAYDKLFFVDKIFEPIDVVVDFGCADGYITKMIQTFYPNSTVIGYDHNPALFKAKGVILTDKMEEVKKRIHGKTALLVMNSVTHEIYNYEKNPTAFLRKLFNMGFKYIWVRDLCVTTDVDNLLDIDSMPEILTKLRQNEKQVHDFEEHFGSITLPINFVHYLMKFRYKDNWEREVEEDYTCFGHNLDAFNTLIEKKYTKVFTENYVLPYTRHINMVDFGLDLCAGNHFTTHFRGLYRLT